MKTITIHLESDRDAELLKKILETTRFESKVETVEDEDDFTEEEVSIFNERVEEYKKNPSVGKSAEEVNQLLKRKYGL
jgi:hypothetical protein